MIPRKGHDEKKTRKPRAEPAAPKSPANKFNPTAQDRAMVQLMAAAGFTQDQAAAQIQGGISSRTLRTYFADEWENGAVAVNLKIAGNLARIAMGSGKEAVTAAIFWTKSRMKWVDNPVTALKLAAETETPAGPVRFTLKIGERMPDDAA